MHKLLHAKILTILLNIDTLILLFFPNQIVQVKFKRIKVHYESKIVLKERNKKEKKDNVFHLCVHLSRLSAPKKKHTFMPNFCWLFLFLCNIKLYVIRNIRFFGRYDKICDFWSVFMISAWMLIFPSIFIRDFLLFKPFQK